MNAIDDAVKEGVLEIVHDPNVIGVSCIDGIFQFLGVGGVNRF